MSTETIAARGRARVDWRRAEFVLTLSRVPRLLHAADPHHDGLRRLARAPAVHTRAGHPDPVHRRRRRRVRRQAASGSRGYGIALAVVSIVAMSSIFVAMQAGAGLRGELNLQGQAAKLISEHSQAAHILGSSRRLHGHADRDLRCSADLRRDADRPRDHRRPAVPAMGAHRVTRRARGGLARRRLYGFRTGDLGAKAVWADTSRPLTAVSPAVRRTGAHPAGRASAPPPAREPRD